MKTGPFSQEDDIQLRRHWRADLSSIEIAQKLDRKQRSVTERARVLGIPFPQRGTRKKREGAA